MNPGIITELKAIAPGCVHPDEPMAKHTSFGLGGPADVYVEPPDEGSLKECAALLKDAGVTIKVLGRGTNMLVRSGGIEGAVLSTEQAFSTLLADGGTVTVGSGVPLSGLLNFCAESGLTGLEPLAGIPGSVGGAAIMNAGSYGIWFADRLESVAVFEPGKSSVEVAGSELDASYRRMGIPEGHVVEGVVLALDEDDPSAVTARLQEIIERKWRTQPVGMRSAGCVFRNFPDKAAWALIDSAGLVGARIGGAVVSDVHANFILNDRGATPDDVEELINLIRERVSDRTGRDLVTEVEIVGRRAH
jgi:UDP-N-acetylmuramate dehydrogenase